MFWDQWINWTDSGRISSAAPAMDDDEDLLSRLSSFHARLRRLEVKLGSFFLFAIDTQSMLRRQEQALQSHWSSEEPEIGTSSFVLTSPDLDSSFFIGDE